MNRDLSDPRHAVVAFCLGAMRQAVLLLCAVLAWNQGRAAVTPAADLRLRWEVEQGATVTMPPRDSSKAILSLTNTGSKALPARGWALFFNCMTGVETGTLAEHLLLEQVVGTLYRLRPAAQFAGLDPGATLRVRIVQLEVPLNTSMALIGPYLVFDDAPDRALALSDYQLTPPPAVAITVTAEEIFDRNAAVTTMPLSELPPVFPSPRHFEPRSGSLRLAALPRIVAPPSLHAEVAAASAVFSRYFTTDRAATEGTTTLRMTVGPIAGESSAEAYELTIDPLTGVELKGATSAGVARALASLRELLPAPQQPGRMIELPALHISDAPRFAYRGLMLDVARNFQSKTAVLKVLELMARFKLNAFHFHLSDDEGWRLEIPGLPELTAIGARRGHGHARTDRLPPVYGSGPDVSDPYGSGYYRSADYIEIVKYAAARHIEVIPEIEMPGHARAAIVAMRERARRLSVSGAAHAGQYLLSDPHDRSVYSSSQLYTDNVMNPGLDSTYAFIAQVVSELVALHKAAGVPLHTIHVGGDEVPAGVWEKSPACQALMHREHLSSKAELWDYFYGRVDALLRRHDLFTSGWEELGAHAVMLEGKPDLAPNPHFAQRGFSLYVWRNIDGAEDLAYRLANAGYDTVLTPATRFYFDHAYYPSPDEPGQNWAGYADLDTVFDYVPDDDIRVAADEPTSRAGKQRLTDRGRQHIRGLEGTLFTETVHEPGRLDYMLMPRLLALAERAWASEPAWTQQSDRAHAAPLHRAAWSRFVSQLGLQVLPRLDAEHEGIQYRIPPPGLKRVAGVVLANEQLPGFSLRYTTDGSEPTAASPLVNGPIAAPGLIRVAAFDHNGRAGRSSQIDSHIAGDSGR